MNVKTAHVRTEDGALTVRDHSLVVVLTDGRDKSVIKVYHYVDHLIFI